MFLYIVYVHSMTAFVIGHQLFSASASKFAVVWFAINGFSVKTKKSSKTKKFDFMLTSSVVVSVAVSNQNRTKIFGYLTGLVYIFIIMLIHTYNHTPTNTRVFHSVCTHIHVLWTWILSACVYTKYRCCMCMLLTLYSCDISLLKIHYAGSVVLYYYWLCKFKYKILKWLYMVKHYARKVLHRKHFNLCQ